MSAPLEGRVAVVTGAGQGVGRGMALALASAGAAVVIAARRAETGEPVAAEVRQRGVPGICIETDVTRRAETVPVSGFVAMARELIDIRSEKTNVP